MSTPRPSPTRLMMVGGFLGAGKTTLLAAAARKLVQRQLRVGLITNDQAADLVDTAWLQQDAGAVGVREVAGSCFCCDFPSLLAAADSLRNDLHADVLIAEPVGSCTDLSATLLQPLKEKYRNDFSIAPLTVLADPLRLLDVLDQSTGLDPAAAYIYRKQLEEADILALSKVDQISDAQRTGLDLLLRRNLPARPTLYLSAHTGHGLDDWLDRVLHSTHAGEHLLDIDYDLYAQGEAVLGWLNAAVTLHDPAGQTDWLTLGSHWLEQLRLTCVQSRSAVGHIKLLLDDGHNHGVVNVTHTTQPATARGSMQPGYAPVTATLNARVEMSPQSLEHHVRASLHALESRGLTVAITTLRCLKPGRPVPTHRYDRIAPGPA